MILELQDLVKLYVAKNNNMLVFIEKGWQWKSDIKFRLVNMQFGVGGVRRFSPSPKITYVYIQERNVPSLT